ncbi:MAG: DUF4194 domain-containing protein [Comamonadaceae bacterium]|nr:MAG: DUF4194 domain-containing protein [Comamonadaceae bacterium]
MPDENGPAQEAPATTPLSLRRALQELLKSGLVEEAAKPQFFRQLVGAAARVDTLLEPLDLRLRLDEMRGLAFVTVAEGYAGEGEEDDEWTHPLVRRQRLTLDQSLLLAILRREFLQCEQESGLGAPVDTTLDALLPQLEIYLGDTGSDMQSRKRLVNLLENLRGHGVVSEIDSNESLTIRPMIVHLANPENLQVLLQRLRELSAAPKESDE